MHLKKNHTQVCQRKHKQRFFRKFKAFNVKSCTLCFRKKHQVHRVRRSRKKVPDMRYYLSIIFVGENHVGTRQILKYDFNLPCISNAREHVYLGWKCQNRCGKRSQKHVGH